MADADINKSINITTNSDEVEQDLQGVGNELDNLDTGTTKVTQSTKDFGSAQKTSAKNVTENGGAVAILDSLTGGMATKFRDAGEATKLFNFSLKGTRTALIATGIGAFVVILALVIAYWDDIKDAITGATKALEDHIELNNRLLEIVESELSVIDSEDVILKQQGKSLDANILKRKKLLDDAISLAQANLEDLKTLLLKEESDARRFNFFQNVGSRGGGPAFGIGFISDREQKKIDDRRIETNKAEEALNKIIARRGNLEIPDVDPKPDPKPDPKAERQILLDIEKDFQQQLKELKEQAVIADIERIRDAAVKSIEESDLAEEKKIENILLIRERAVQQIKILEDEKLQAERDAAVIAIEEGSGNETEKRLAIQSINDFYDQVALDKQQEFIDKIKNLNDTSDAEIEAILEAARLKKIDDDAIAAQKVIDDKEIADQAKLDEVEQLEQLEQQKTAIRLQSLDNLSRIFGQETALGKAALVAKQLLLAAELAISISKIQFKATELIADGQMHAAEAGVAVVAGAGETLGAGFPAAIPLLIAYAAAAAGIIASITAAAKRSKNIATQLGGSGGGGDSIPALPQAQFNIVGASGTDQIVDAIGTGFNQEPIQAFVVSSEITSQQALDRNRQNNSTFL